MAEKLVVGQTVLHDWRGDRNLTVEKAHRKYAQSGELRLNMETREVTWENGRHAGYWYRDEAHREEVRKAGVDMRLAYEAWTAFRNALPYQRPEGATADAIRQAAALLGIQLPTDTQENANG